MTANKAQLCKDWRILKFSKQDAKETQRDVVGNNVARGTWCK